MEDSSSGNRQIANPPSGVLLISGVPGAGKTTVSRLVARQLPRSGLIDADQIHDLVISGRKYQAEGPSEEVDRQVELRIQNVAVLADNLARAGFLPVIDEVVVEVSRLKSLRAKIQTTPIFLAILAPDRKVVEERDRNRSDKHVFERWSHLDEIMRREMAGLGCWIDSTLLTPEETAAEVMHRVWIEGLIAD